LKTSPNKEKQYLSFVRKVIGTLKKQYNTENPASLITENYRFLGEVTEGNKTISLVFNNKSTYYEDTKTYNSFIRVRRDHMKRQGIKFVEVDFYDVRSLSYL
jgi:hypothetical protein